MADEIEFIRLVLDDGSIRYVEVGCDGATVYVVSGLVRDGASPTVEAKALASAASAQRSVEKRVAALRGKGYLDDGVVRRQRPRTASEVRAEAMEAGRRAFEAALPRFLAAWRERGYDPLLSFLAQCRGRRGLHPDEVTRQCLAVATEVFGVGFALRSRGYDDEHGHARRVPSTMGRLAEHYRSPSGVLSLARQKLQGRHLRDDDDESYGLADEIEQGIRAARL